MSHFGTFHLQAFSSIGMIVMALLAIFVRSRSARKPLSVMKIIMPPVGMSTGFFMFVIPAFRIPWAWGLISFSTGLLLFSYPLIKSSQLESKGGAVYVKRSKMFMFVLLGLLLLRVALHSYIEEHISIPQTGALFFILAFGMLLPWRLAMLVQYRKLMNGSKNLQNY